MGSKTLGKTTCLRKCNGNQTHLEFFQHVGNILKERSLKGFKNDGQRNFAHGEFSTSELPTRVHALHHPTSWLRFEAKGRESPPHQKTTNNITRRRKRPSWAERARIQKRPTQNETEVSSNG